MMSKKEAMMLFAEARRLKAELVGKRNLYPEIKSFKDAIADVDRFLTLEEKVRNMKRAEITRKVEEELVAISHDIARSSKVVIMTARSMRSPDALMAITSSCDANISTECSG